ncbi:hypothetical protein LDO26_13515 [Luteimonas sp. BDR2-5]|uniref:hypothetical protein n=1 Tax=Proluteimonas luteida TaxID=2878685 RepID=UPI001E402233|nr:hypothetical protein [Luteimonas sp. BDR2-5]MCD9029216.1 hypothetical protein [Luteimonas sp. BDR2-5]
MIRTIFSVMAGMLVAMMLMLGLEFLGSWLFPLPGGQLTSEADLAEIVANASTGKLAWVLLGWLVAAFGGGWVAAKLARVHRVGAAVAVGVLIVLGVLLNAWLLPHPLWMSLLGVLGPVPLAWTGGRLVARRHAPAR